MHILPCSLILTPDRTGIKLTGTVDFNNAVELRCKGRQLFQECVGQYVQVDLHAISHRDSSILSLLLAWLRDAHHHGKNITYCHAPELLCRIARVYGVESLLFSR